ncbi:energy transducer TonB [Pseudoalteromonas rubra]|uniref:Energy transducer TonB n=1 Tax=Pseudoalteromonas rubra TaxID=43658 RepID=A0A0F4QDV1_9GAMM|nr:energy transducer TonB [Pseudoalteromonas rubra]KJZ05881.1 energy transducer TonB [Pseudoalteromonas rubra]
MRYCLLAGLSFLSAFNVQSKTLFGDVRLTEVQPSLGQVVWVPNPEYKPLYPISLARKGTAGCAIFKVTVNARGNTESVELLYSAPSKSLSRPGKKILSKWPWSTAQGTAAQAEEKTVRLDFCLGGQSVDEAQALCKAQAALSCEA